MGAALLLDCMDSSCHNEGEIQCPLGATAEPTKRFIVRHFGIFRVRHLGVNDNLRRAG